MIGAATSNHAATPFVLNNQSILVKCFILFHTQNGEIAINKSHLVCVWLQIKKPAFFTIQLIFATIHESHYTFQHYSWVTHYTILTNFYLYLQYFQQKVFSFSKISGSQTNPLSIVFMGPTITSFSFLFLLREYTSVT